MSFLPFLLLYFISTVVPGRQLTPRGEKQLGFTTLPDTKPEKENEGEGEGEGGDMQKGAEGSEKVLRDLHTLLLETQVTEGKLVCGNCGHEYAIKEGIANFLLPSHLGEWIPYLLFLLIVAVIGSFGNGDLGRGRGADRVLV